MKSKQKAQAEVKYHTQSRKDFQVQYLSDTFSNQRVVKEELTEEEYKAKAEEDYKRLIYEVWKDKDKLDVLLVLLLNYNREVRQLYLNIYQRMSSLLSAGESQCQIKWWL